MLVSMKAKLESSWRMGLIWLEVFSTGRDSPVKVDSFAEVSTRYYSYVCRKYVADCKLYKVSKYELS